MRRYVARLSGLRTSLGRAARIAGGGGVGPGVGWGGGENVAAELRPVRKGEAGAGNNSVSKSNLARPGKGHPIGRLCQRDFHGHRSRRNAGSIHETSLTEV